MIYDKEWNKAKLIDELKTDIFNNKLIAHE